MAYQEGYLKIHVAVDIRKKKIVSLQVTSEEVHDSKMLKHLVDHVLENNTVARTLCDGSYDNNNNFQYNRNQMLINFQINENTGNTEVLYGIDNVVNAKLYKATTSNWNWCYKKAFVDAKNRGVKLKYLTEITFENVTYCKELMSIVNEIRHLE